MIVNIELEEKDIDEIHDMLCDWLGIDFTSKQICELVNKDILLYMSQYGVYDTFAREALMDSIGQKIVGRKIPINREKREQYWDQFVENAQSLGYNVILNA